MELKLNARSVRPGSSQDVQTVKNLLKIENAKQILNFPMKSGN